MFWIKIVGSTYGDYSSQTVELLLWKGFRSKKTLSSKTLIYKYWNCILRLRLKIVKENHTLFSVQTNLGQIRPGSAPHAPGSVCKLWKESGIWSFRIILDESGKIDSSVNVAFRVTFHVSLLLTKWTVAIYRRIKKCSINLTRAGNHSILSLWRAVFYRSTSLNKFIRVALWKEKSHVDKMKMFLIYIIFLLTMLGTSTASGNVSEEGKTCVIFTSALFALFSSMA